MAILGLDKRLIAPSTKRWMQIGAASGLLGLFASLALFSLVGRIIDGALGGENVLPRHAWLLAGIVVSKGVLGYVSRLATYEAASQTKLTVRDLMYRHALALGSGALGKKRTGELVNTAVDGMEWLEQYYGVYFVQFVVGIATPVVLCVYITSVDWVVGVALIAAIPLTPMFLGAMGKQFKRVSERYFSLNSELSAQFLDSLQGMPTLKMFNAGKLRGQRMYTANEKVRVETMRLLLVNQVSIFLTDWGFALATTVVMAYACFSRIDSGALSAGTAVSLLLISSEFARPLNLIGAFFFAGAIGREVANQIIGFLDEAPKVREREGATAPEVTAPSLELRDVTFTYEGAKGPALSHVSLRLELGETLALVGRSGAGKSTLTQLLLRSYELDSGQILLGGTPLSELPLDWVRAQFALVPQDPYLFYGSFADNLRVANEHATRKELEVACRAAQLHEYIASTPQGYDTLIGERGLSISGGQAQRLAIARALLKKAPYVLLDEPTAHIDAETEGALRVALGGALRGRTVILIAHRLSTVEQADRVAVLEQGRLVEIGAPRVLAASGGAYARMLGIHGDLLGGRAERTKAAVVGGGASA